MSVCQQALASRMSVHLRHQWPLERRAPAVSSAPVISLVKMDSAREAVPVALRPMDRRRDQPLSASAVRNRNGEDAQSLTRQHQASVGLVNVPMCRPDRSEKPVRLRMPALARSLSTSYRLRAGTIPGLPRSAVVHRHSAMAPTVQARGQILYALQVSDHVASAAGRQVTDIWF